MSTSRQLMPWLGLLAFALAVGWLEEISPGLHSFPSDWRWPLADLLNHTMDALAEAGKPVTRLLAAALEAPMVALRDSLQWLPWPVTLLGTAALAWRTGGIRLATICALSLLYIALSGYWAQAMNTLALVGIAVPLSLALGLLGGILAQRSRLGARVVPLALDVMQTLPTFAYLIPLLVLFGFGPVVGLIASAIYACPPMVRNVNLGLRQVSSEIVEAARISGATARQQLLWVELPAAMPQIKVGINQTIMAALSMVIIASVIGGFDDIGWEVLSTMRKARFGESLLAGFVIVLIAIVMDRISSAWATRQRASAELAAGRKQRVTIAILLFLAALCVLLKLSGAGAAIDSSTWTAQLSQSLDRALEAAVVNWNDVLTAIKNASFFYYLLPLKIGFDQAILPFTWGVTFSPEMRYGYAAGVALVGLALAWAISWRTAFAFLAAAYVLYFGLTGAPWSVLAAAVLLLGWQLGGWRLASFVGFALAFILLSGLWERSMTSLYLCLAAALLAFAIGSAIGVAAASNDTVSRLVRPVADTFQTIPLFVFLIPVLMFFQIGEFTALLAIVAYAFVPAIRYTESGLRNVSAELLEVAREQGCTPWQSFWQIRLPLAAPSILVGLNQTIMYAFAMLVIAALVGTTGLGQEIFRALSEANTGKGLVAGLCMALLAMVTDRILQSWANSRFRQPS